MEDDSDEHCKKLGSCVVLEDGNLGTSKQHFVDDKQHLESVLGQARESWFEEFTFNKIQIRKGEDVKETLSVMDSPVCSPTISQLIYGRLPVGHSPVSVRHSSPVPYCKQDHSFMSKFDFQSPQFHQKWNQPAVGLSPGPSPIIQNIVETLHPGKHSIHSLGLDDSALSWTNSFATPPRDTSATDCAEESLAQRKETARALFSPGSCLDSTSDSINTLDSTVEEIHSDVETHPVVEISCDKHITGSIEASKIVTQDSGNVKLSSNENSKKRSKRRQEESKKLKLESGSLSTSACMELQELNVSETVNEVNSDENRETSSSSPKFSQTVKGNRFRIRNTPLLTDSPTMNSPVSDILSDFFDPPSSSLRRRRPAPSIKRKSLEMEEILSCVTPKMSCNDSRAFSSSGTPEGSLKSILSSDKKRKDLSNKKVRFSTSVKKCCYIPEQSSSSKTPKSVNRSKKRKPLIRSSNVVQEDEVDEVDKNKIIEVNSDLVGKRLEILSAENVGTCPKEDNAKTITSLGNNDKTLNKKLGDRKGFVSVNDTVLKDSNLDINNSLKDIPNKCPEAVGNDENSSLKLTVRKKVNELEASKSIMSNDLDQSLENESPKDELFSQISPTSLTEMCSVAENSLVHENANNDTSLTPAVKGEGNNIVQRSGSGMKIGKYCRKKFFYPSISVNSESKSPKVFQFQEDRAYSKNRRTLLQSVSSKDLMVAEKKDTNMKILDSSLDIEKNDKTVSSHSDVKENEERQVELEMSTPAVVEQNKTLKYKTSNNVTSLKKVCKPKLSSDVVASINSSRGFQGASGKTFNISSTALEKAKAIFDDDSVQPTETYAKCGDDFDKISSSNYLRYKTVNYDAEMIIKNDSQMSKTESSCISSVKTNENIELIKEQAKCVPNSFNGFQSASGKTCHVSSSALKEAKNLFEDDRTNDQPKTCNSVLPENKTVAIETRSPSSFSKDVSHDCIEFKSTVVTGVEDEFSQWSEEEMEEMDPCDDIILSSYIENDITGHRGGIETGDSDKTQKNIHNDFVANALDNKNYIKSLDSESSIICSKHDTNETVKSKDNISLINESVAVIEKQLSSDNQNSLGFQMTSGKVIQFSEEKLKLAEALFNAGKDDNTLNGSYKQNEVDKFAGFQMASGKTIGISAEKLKHAEALLDADKCEEKLDKSDIKDVQNEIEGSCRFKGFQKASGKSIEITAEKLNHAQNMLDSEKDSDNKYGMSVGQDRGSDVCSNTPDLTKMVNLKRHDTLSSNSILPGFKPVNKTSYSHSHVSKEDTNVDKFQSKTKDIGLKFMFENELLQDAQSMENELDLLGELKSKILHQREDNLCQSETACKSTTSKKCHGIKENLASFPSRENLPQGFRPFKAPKMILKTKDSNDDISEIKSDKQNNTTKAPDLVTIDNGVKCNDFEQIHTVSDKACNTIDINCTTAKLEEGTDNILNGTLEKLPTDSFVFKQLHSDKQDESDDPVSPAENVNEKKKSERELDNYDSDLFQGLSQFFEDEMEFEDTGVSSEICATEDVATSLTHKSSNNDSDHNSNIVQKMSLPDGMSPNLSVSVINNYGIHVNVLSDDDGVEKSVTLKNTSQNNQGESKDGNVTNLTSSFHKLANGQSKFFNEGSNNAKMLEISMNDSGFGTGVSNNSKLTESVLNDDVFESTFDQMKDKLTTCETSSGVDIFATERIRKLDEPSVSFSGFKTASGTEIKMSEHALRKAKETFVNTDEINNECSTELNLEGEILHKDIDKVDVHILSGDNQTEIEIFRSPKILGCDKKSSEITVVDECFQSESSQKIYDARIVTTNQDMKDSFVKLRSGDENTGTTKSIGMTNDTNTKLDDNKKTKDNVLSLVNSTSETKSSQTALEVLESKSVSSCAASGTKVSFTDEAFENDVINCEYTEINFEETTDEFDEVLKEEAKSMNGTSANILDSSVKVPHSRSSLKGFSTASGKKMELSEQALKHARDTLDSAMKENESIPTFEGFSTASGKKVVFSEEALKNARDTLNSAVKETIIEPAFKGFIAASGKKIEISEQAVKHTQNALDSAMTEVISKPAFEGFSTASGKKVEFCEHALKHAQDTLDSDVKETISEPSFKGFSTASGKKVELSEQALKHARNNLDSAEKEVIFRPAFEGFSTASGKKVEMSIETDNAALKHTKDTSDNSIKENASRPTFEGFSTASGKKVELSEHALKHARDTLDSAVKETSLEPASKGFSTTSGKKVELSEHALKHARDTLDSTMKVNESIPTFEGFSTASGKKVVFSEEALKNAIDALNNTMKESSPQPAFKPGFEGFSTASGRKVELSEHALKHARDTLESSEKETISTPVFEGFSSASGKKVQMNIDALKRARDTLDSAVTETNSRPDFKGFSTASGKKVMFSEEALKNARDTLDNAMKETSPKPAFKPDFEGFSTASGKKVELSEHALKHARDTLDSDVKETISEPPFKGFSSASGKKVELNEHALKHARDSFNSSIKENESIQTFEGFSTASGKTVVLSEEALKNVRDTLDNTMKETTPKIAFGGFSTASGKEVDLSEQAFKHARDTLDSVVTETDTGTTFQGFSTASSKKVEMSDEALKHARDSLDSAVKENVKCDNDLKGTENKHNFIGFNTASGKIVKFNEGALQHVKQVFDEDIRLKGHQIVPHCSLASRDEGNCSVSDVRISDNPENVPVLLGFSTAAGKNVDVSEQALKYIKTSILEEQTMVVDETCSDSMHNFVDNKGSHISKHNEVTDDSNNMDAVEEMFANALKRQKLEANRERKVHQTSSAESNTLKRKQAKTSCPDKNTDKRHPGFRPFKPVFSKLNVETNSRSPVSVTGLTGKQAGLDTGSFKTPYKTPLALNTASLLGQRISSNDTSVPEMGKGDGPAEVADTESAVLKSDSVISNSKADIGKINNKGKDQVGNMTNFVDETKVKVLSDGDVVVSMVVNEGGDNRVKKESHKPNMIGGDSVVDEVKEVCVDNVVTNDNYDFGSFSQDEDDVYYCMLVEARRSQDDLIKQQLGTRVKPVAGKLWNKKQTNGRWKLKDFIDKKALHQKSSLHKEVTSRTAVGYTFDMEQLYGRNKANVTCGDGAYLVPDDSGKVGKYEIYRAFLTVEGVDSKLITDVWVYNHYKWIIWKLAVYERFLSCSQPSYLTPDVVLLQLKYRYDREIDRAQRSSVKKIYERDDTPSKRIVLCVADITYVNIGETSGANHGHRPMLGLTDGWYHIPTQLDLPLSELVQSGKICVGQKLCVTGAELVGGEDACTPLEAPASVMLKISRNSTRPASWDCRLGYQSDPRPLCVPLSSLCGEGGVVGIVDVIIVRKYPTMYMEKLEAGGCTFRTSKCEERARQEFDTRKQVEMEKVYRLVESTAEKDEVKDKKVTGRKTFTRTCVEGLQTGREIYEAIEEAARPDTVQNYLSEQQMGMLYEYQRQVMEEKQSEINSKFRNAWQEKSETFKERVVTPVLKLRVSGCSNRDLDSKTSTILTVWRPSAEISDIQEGHRYKIYSLNTSVSRSKYTGHHVQLTATKQTRYRRMQLDENILDNIYEAREVLLVSDIKRFQPIYGELDFVGIIVKLSSSSQNNRSGDMVYLADYQIGIIAVRFTNGFKSFGDDMFVVGNTLCCSNLMDKSPYRSHSIPVVDATTELTQISNKPLNASQRRIVDKLNTSFKDKKQFMNRALDVISEFSGDKEPLPVYEKIKNLNDEFKIQFPNRGKVISDQSESVNKDNSSKATSENVHNPKESFKPVSSEYTSADSDRHVKSIVESSLLNEKLVENNKSGDKVLAENNGAVMGEEKLVQEGSCSQLMTITPSPDVNKSNDTPVTQRRRSLTQTKLSKLSTYGSPSVLSPLNVSLPRSINRGFKPPAFKKL